MGTASLRVVLRQLRRAATPRIIGVADADLLGRFVRNRDEAAFELLVRRHEKLILGLLRRMLPGQDAIDDAFQATFVAFARKAQSINKGQSIGSWLYRVAYRVALRARWSYSRRNRHEQSVAVLPEPSSFEEPEEELAWRDLRPVLDEELNGLPDKYRNPLVLCYLEGKSYREAAKELGCAPGTVSTWLTRGREMLRKRLSRRGVGLSVGVLALLLARQAAGFAATARLVDATVKSALSFVSGSTTSSLSAEVLTLASGVLKTMFFAKMKTAALILMTMGLMGVMAASVVHQLSAAEPAQSVVGVAAQSAAEDAEDESPSGVAWRERLTLEADGSGSAGSVLTLAVSPDGRLLAVGTAEPSVRVWDLATGKAVLRLAESAPGETIRSVRFSPDGRTLAVGGQGRTVRLWDVESNRVRRELTGHGSSIRGLAFSPDGRTLVTAGEDRVVRLWDHATGTQRWQVSSHGRSVSAVAFSPDGKVLASGGEDGTVRVWDAETGKEVRRYQRHQGPVWTLTFSPDGRIVVSAGEEKTVRLWEAATGKELSVVQVDRDRPAVALAVSPDGKLVAAGGPKERVLIIDLATGKIQVELRGFKQPVQALAFSPDGRRLITGGSDGVVKVWEADRAQAWRRRVAIGASSSPDRLDHLVTALAAGQRSSDQLAEALYLATLSRLPTELEVKAVRDHLGQKKDRAEALKDVLFALTTTKEFTANLESLNRRRPSSQKRELKP